MYNCICCGKFISEPAFICEQCRGGATVNTEVLRDILLDHRLCTEQRQNLLLAIDYIERSQIRMEGGDMN